MSDALQASRGRGRGGPKGRGGGRGRGKRGKAFGGQLTEQTGVEAFPSSANGQAPETSIVVTAESQLLVSPGNTVVSTAEVTVEVVDIDADICFICAEPIKYYALGACSHRVCHVCSVRLRALYKKNNCTLCQTDLPNVIFTTNPDAPFSSFMLFNLAYTDSKLGIHCETREQLDATVALLRFSCPHSACDAVLGGWPDLKRHTRSIHNMQICDICTCNKKVFTYEHTLFTPQGLSIHMSKGEVGAGKGEEGGGAGKDEGFQGHPKCDYCGIHFYDVDEIKKHCQQQHEQCFICTRNGSGQWLYYLDYNHLESHFRKDHHLCLSAICQEKRFIVFEHAFELQSHQVAEHGTELGKAATKDARRLETHFTYSTPTASTSNGNNQPAPQQTQNGSRIKGRKGRDGGAMSIQPIGAPSQMIDASRSIVGMSAPVGGSSNGNNRSANSRRAERMGFRSGLTTTQENQASNESAIHEALMRKVGEATNGSESKLASFKAAVRGYRNSEMAVSGLIDTIWRVMDERMMVASEVVSDLIAVFEASKGPTAALDSERATELSIAWVDFESQKTQFPTLTGAPAPHKPTATKNRPTVQPAVPAVRPAQPVVWARVEAAAYARLMAPPPPKTKDKYSLLSSTSKGIDGRAIPGLSSSSRASTSSGSSKTAWSASAASTLGSSGALSSSGWTKLSAPTSTSSSTLENSTSTSVASSFPAFLETPSTSASPLATILRSNNSENGTSFPSLPVDWNEVDRKAKVRDLIGRSKARNANIMETSMPVEVNRWGPLANLSENGNQDQSEDSEGVGNNGDSSNSNQGGKKQKKVLLFTNSR